jgi:TolB protein
MSQRFSLSPPAASLLSRRALLNGLLVPAACGLTLSNPAWAQFRVEISGIGATQLPIALLRCRDEDKASVAISAIVRADLERSGLFRFIDVAPTHDETGSPAFADLRSRGADALAAGSVTRLVDGRFDVRYKLWDVVKGADQGGQSLAVPAADLRLAAHRIADAIYEKLTGDKGVFSTRIAYVTKGAGRYTLRITDADGEGGQVALTSPEPIISPAWSPDGRELAVTLSRDGGSQIFLINRDGSNPRRITNSRAIDTEPVFTPDGKSLYFVSDRGGSPQIYRQSLDAGSAERVTFNGAYNISPALSPDGRHMAYVQRLGSGSFRVQVMELASGAVQTPSDTNDDESPSFSPNGRFLIYASRAQGQEVLMTSTLDGKIRSRLLSSGLDIREPVWGPFGR